MKIVIFSIVTSLMLFSFSGCSASPKGAYALKTKEYGQCRSVKKGERFRYKKKRVKYICEDDTHVLVGKPYQIKDDWFYPSGELKGKKVSNLGYSKIVKVYHNRCELKGAYGSGNDAIRKFYFASSIKACKPFSWSGKGGLVPFDSVDECEMKCHP